MLGITFLHDLHCIAIVFAFDLIPVAEMIIPEIFINLDTVSG